jgi:hypothetical protein
MCQAYQVDNNKACADAGLVESRSCCSGLFHQILAGPGKQTHAETKSRREGVDVAMPSLLVPLRPLLLDSKSLLTCRLLWVQQCLLLEPELAAVLLGRPHAGRLQLDPEVGEMR